MSRHHIKAAVSGFLFEIQIGYDPPLGHFFLTVVRVCNGEEELVYSNLADNDAFDKDLNSYRSKLSELGLYVPEAVFEELERERCLDQSRLDFRRP
jgi:hypothetical protein